MFELRHLRHAIGLAEHKNFARAAQALHISQPALSRSIQTLEGQLGVRLFDRDQGGVEPTIYGHLLLERACELDVAANDLLREIELAKGMAQGELKVGVGPWGAAMLVSEVVGAISLKHPQLRFNLLIGPWKELPSRLASRQIDMAIVNVSEIHANEELEVVPLGAHPMVLVCRAGHPLTEQAQPSLREVFQFPMAAPELPISAAEQLLFHMPPDLRSQLSRQGLARITCDSSSVLKSIVANSDAFTFVNAFMVLDELKRGELCLIPNIDIGSAGQFGVVRLRRRSLSDAAQTFVKLLRVHDKIMAERESAYLENINTQFGNTGNH